MEILLIFTIATILLIDILALKLLQDNLINEIYDAHMCIEHTIISEHKKTRKEAQEIKTRLTQIRKDLNKGILPLKPKHEDRKTKK